MNKVAMKIAMEFIHGLSNIDIHLSKMTWPWPLLSTKSACSRDQQWVHEMVPFPGVTSQLPGGRCGLHWITSIMKGAVFCSYWDKHWLWIWIWLPCIEFLLKLPSMDLQNTLSSIHQAIPHSAISGQETHFTEKVVQQWGHPWGIHWSYHMSHHPETTFWQISEIAFGRLG